MNNQPSPKINRKHPLRRIVKALLLLAAAVPFCIMLLFASLWAEHTLATTLPQPTGPYAVGRSIFDWTDFDWTDDQTKNASSPSLGAKHELLVWIWYPAVAGSAPAADYLPAEMRTAIEQHMGVLLSKFLTRDLAKVRGHSLRDAEISPALASYPLVILRAGASLEVADYTSLAEDLASHGYVVVGFDAPYRTATIAFPDGRVISQLPANNPESCLAKAAREREDCATKILMAWIQDTAFVLQRLEQLDKSASSPFKGKLDFNRVGLFGHSFGGAAVALFCHEDQRCRAGIDLDGAPHGDVIRAGINHPFMFLLSDHSRESDPDGGQIMADIRSIYDRLPPDSRQLLMIRGANHFTFTDDGALFKSRAVLAIFRATGRLKIDARGQLAVTSYCLRIFFDAYLKESNTPGSQILSPFYPELQPIK